MNPCFTRLSALPVIGAMLIAGHAAAAPLSMSIDLQNTSQSYNMAIYEAHWNQSAASAPGDNIFWQCNVQGQCYTHDGKTDTVNYNGSTYQVRYQEPGVMIYSQWITAGLNLGGNTPAGRYALSTDYTLGSQYQPIASNLSYTGTLLGSDLPAKPGDDLYAQRVQMNYDGGYLSRTSTAPIHLSGSVSLFEDPATTLPAGYQYLAQTLVTVTMSGSIPYTDISISQIVYQQVFTGNGAIDFLATSDIFNQYGVNDGINTLGLSISVEQRLAVTSVSQVPVPASAWLFGTSVIALTSFKRNRKTPQSVQ